MRPPLKVAVVDDHKLFRKGLVAQLKEFPELTVAIEASNGEELLEQLEIQTVDVVLLDIQMPVMNGIETTEKLKVKYGDIKIIIITMHNDEGYIHQLINKGVNGFLLKDQSIEVVVDAVYDVMANDYYVNDKLPCVIIKKATKSEKRSPMLRNVVFSEKELKIIRLICLELTNRQIADKLFVSVRTIDGHKQRILQKTKAKNVIGIVVYAHKHHLL
jgi:two-component system response regulator DegU